MLLPRQDPKNEILFVLCGKYLLNFLKLYLLQKVKMHPAMYEDPVSRCHQGSVKLRCSEKGCLPLLNLAALVVIHTQVMEINCMILSRHLVWQNHAIYFYHQNMRETRFNKDRYPFTASQFHCTLVITRNRVLIHSRVHSPSMKDTFSENSADIFHMIQLNFHLLDLVY